MNNGKLFLMMIFLCSFSLHLFGQESENIIVDWETANYGKAQGWIIDPDTNKPVDQAFILLFEYIEAKPRNPPIVFRTQTDNNGYFSRKLVPGKFYLDAYPIQISKYCEDIPHKNDPKNPTVIEIKSGQITKLYKKARVGGNLKIIMVDSDGQKINIENIFKNQEFKMKIESKTVPQYKIISGNKNSSIDKREFLFENFPSGRFVISLNSEIGIRCVYIENLVIEPHKTTEYKFILDIKTGIEGVIKTPQGRGIHSSIEIYGVTVESLDISLEPDDSGYYHLVGLKEGRYMIRVISLEDEFESIDIETKIEKNKILKFDVTLKQIQ